MEQNEYERRKESKTNENINNNNKNVKIVRYQLAKGRPKKWTIVEVEVNVASSKDASKSTKHKTA